MKNLLKTSGGMPAMFRPGLGGAVVILALLLFLVPHRAAAGDPETFPAYGNGEITVRLYTDYFCPHCRAMEPVIAPALDNLLKKKAVSLVLVDVPYNRYSPLYARYFLYALKEDNRWEHARRVRQLLDAAAAGGDIKTREQLDQFFRQRGISWTVFDPQAVFSRFNSLIREDNVKSIPTCVIIRNGKKEVFIGDRDIPQALKRLP